MVARFFFPSVLLLASACTSMTANNGRIDSKPSQVAGAEFRQCADCPVMVVVPAGEFVMGSASSETGHEADEEPMHDVRFAAPFAVGKFDVSFDEWQACVSAKACAEVSDESWGRGRRPVINVSFDQAAGYIAWLSRETNARYRLLSEAEWEYAARAGNDRPHYWDPTTLPVCRFASVYDQLGKQGKDFGWPNFDCIDGFVNTAPVGSFKPNAFGLYDMLGNVLEWTADCYNNSYAGAPGDGSAWMTGPCTSHVRRGGSWHSEPLKLRVAKRGKGVRGGDFQGFRVALTLS